MRRVVVIGVGNTFRHDDGVGPAVILALRQQGLADVELADSDGEATRLLDLWAEADLAIVVDAVRTLSVPPGTVHRRSLLHPSFGRVGLGASHAADLGDAVALAAALDRLPNQLLLYAVEAADTSLGVGLSPAVADAVAQLVDEIVEEVTWRPARP
jgi:hydrogenase maturation protease